MHASMDCVEFWNGWFRKVKKGQLLDPKAIVVNHIPSDIIWEGVHGRLAS